jgi:hypothetical protein
MNGALVCVQNVQPSPETCDGLDNDCDGMVDEGNPGGGATCNTGKLGVCAAGTVTCVAAALSCVENVPASPEVCDGLDNDCDGMVDEGDPGGGATCNTGLLGVCSAGVTACSGGTIACDELVQPSQEVCDGLDNDCDGMVDEGDPGGGGACTTGKPGVCGPGTVTCSLGALTCAENVQPSQEVCDGLDNDCDGVVDEGNPGGGAACSTGLLGVCAAGTVTCTNAALKCAENVQPSPEKCDALDNDCDGLVDEGNPCTCTHSRCVTGGALVSGCDAPAGDPSCVQKLCAQDTFCCTTLWDSICVSEVGSICGISPCY